MKINGPTAICLAVIILAAGTLRFAGFKNPHGMTWDEEFYVQMGDDLSKDLSNYNCRFFVDIFKHSNLAVPEYLNEPLFKHPPLFCYMLSAIFKIGGATYEAASIIPIAFGLLLVFLSFVLGSYLFNRITGLCAALLVSIDPINWACSEKIWMETSLAAFMWLAVYFIIKASVEKRYYLYYLAGIFSGLAVLTKYPGFLVIPIGFTIVAIEDRRSFGSAHFWMWPAITLVMFAPWVIWNAVVYGSGLAEKIAFLHEIKLYVVLLSAAAIAAAFITAAILKAPAARLALVSALLIFVFTRQYAVDGIVNVLNAAHVPLAGWEPGMFQYKPWTFYFRRMIELSPFYLFAFAGLLFLAKKGSKEKLLIIPALWGLLFFVIWGSYQSRYILFASLGLLVLAARTAIWCWEKIGEKTGSATMRMLLRACFAIILAYATVKTLSVDLSVVITNDFSYF
ncbi:MAG: glycosyltransferase family 39 protein [Candidatus Omnitrophota bacterium]